MVEKIKASRYNHFVALENGNRLAFNALTCGLAEMDPDSYQRYCDLIARGETNGDSQDDLIANLKKGGFITPAELNEMDAIRAAHYQARFGIGGIGYTIVPTLRCNFACDYCYEGGGTGRLDRTHHPMTEETIGRIVNLARLQVPRDSALTVTWYGGEPLLAPTVIDRLTKDLIAVCAEKNTKDHSRMVTNGYLLDQKTADCLKDWRIAFVQVTVDGPRETHDLRRPLRGGHPTYDVVMENLEAIGRQGEIRLAIRMNIDRRNSHMVGPLLQDLHQRGFHEMKKVTIYFGHTVHFSTSCPDVAAQCMAGREFSEFMVQAYRDAMELGFQIAMFPALQTSTCGAIGNAHLLIEPDGSIQNCWNAVGRPEMCTGRLTDDGLAYNNELNRWRGWNAFRQECSECSVLPLCMGACPFKTLYPREVSGIEDNTCVWWKHNLSPMLELFKAAKTRNLLFVPRIDIPAEAMDQKLNQ